MSRDGYRGPKLPKFLLDQVQNSNKTQRGSSNVSRKDRRKAERQQKKSIRSRPKQVTSTNVRPQNASPDDEDSSGEEERTQVKASAPNVKPKCTAEPEQPPKSILKKPKVEPPSGSESDSISEQEASLPVVPRHVKSKLADDDAEIADLEKKLGIKGKKSKASQSDGLNWLVDGSDHSSDDDSITGSKRKRPEDTKWLQEKRLKASASKSAKDAHEDDLSDGSDSIMADSDGSIEDEGHFEDPASDMTENDDFDGFDSEDHEATPEPKRQRENPYLPPVSDKSSLGGKYVPPSLRRPDSSNEEVSRQLRRQLQGLLNRLSEANLLSILKSLEDLYAKNARQHVNSTLVDLLLGLIADGVTLNDSFLILHAGFAAGVFKTFGPDFGAFLLEKLVEALEYHREKTLTTGKQSLNLLAFLSCLYNLQVVGSGIVFDYIRLLLDELSENNTELLLRVMRTSGQQLRVDDPSALKDIVLLLQRAVNSAGEEQLSVRTKFMIETINDLKNNRMRGAAAGSALAAEHISRMRKVLGSLNNTRLLKSTEPLRITLSDIQDSEKKGKWWLVGASYLNPSKQSADNEANKPAASSNTRVDDAGYESETPGSVNLHKLARNQGMNTDVRRAIFITILSSSDHKEAHERLLKLHLKSKQTLEIPRVIVHCAGAEHAHNPFYAILAHHFCTEHKIRKAFQFTLWDVFQQMEAGDEEISMRKLVNLAKLYAHLIANGGVDIRILKKLEFTYLNEQTRMFVEVLLTTVFLQLGASHKRDLEKSVKEIFARTAGISNLSHGLRVFLEDVVKRTELASSKKEKKVVEQGRIFAIEALAKAAEAAAHFEDDEDEEDSDD